MKGTSSPIDFRSSERHCASSAWTELKRDRAAAAAHREATASAAHGHAAVEGASEWLQSREAMPRAGKG